MSRVLKEYGWPLLVGLLVALLVIERFPHWVGLPSTTLNVQQAPAYTSAAQGPVSYEAAVSRASPAVVNLYTTKVVSKPLPSL